MFTTQIAFQLRLKPFLICVLQLPSIWEFQLLVFRQGLIQTKMFVSCWFQLSISSHGVIPNKIITSTHVMSR